MRKNDNFRDQKIFKARFIDFGYSIKSLFLAKKCNCQLPCYQAVTEIEMIQQGEYLWQLDGSIDPQLKEEVKNL